MPSPHPDLLRPPPEVLERLCRLHPELDDRGIEALGRFLDMLQARNAQMNLTAVRDPAAMWPRHVLDSLTLLPWFPQQGRAADLGSGGGLPALPLAIIRPNVELTLVESVGKKARFLEETARALDLTHVSVLSERIERVGHGALRGSMDVVTARALARLPVLLELSLPLLRVGGALLAIKGEQAETEIEESRRALQVLHGEVERMQRTDTGTIVVVRKRAATPQRYPRSPGEPKRRPLLP